MWASLAVADAADARGIPCSSEPGADASAIR